LFEERYGFLRSNVLLKADFGGEIKPSQALRELMMREQKAE